MAEPKKTAEPKEEDRKFETERQKHNYNEVCRIVKSHIDEVLKRGILSSQNKSRRVVTTIYVNDDRAFTLESQYSHIGQMSVHSECQLVGRAISDLYLEDRAVLRPGDNRIFGHNTQDIVDHIYDIVANIPAPITYETKVKYTKNKTLRANILAIIIAVGTCFLVHVAAHENYESWGYDSSGYWTYNVDWDSYYLVVYSAFFIVAMIYLLFLVSTIIGNRVDGNKN